MKDLETIVELNTKESRINLIEENGRSRRDSKRNVNVEEPALEMLQQDMTSFYMAGKRQSRRCGTKQKESKRAS
jgi:hypothetical protein